MRHILQKVVSCRNVRGEENPRKYNIIPLPWGTGELPEALADQIKIIHSSHSIDSYLVTFREQITDLRVR
jgi:hypothetical protein